MRKGIDWLPPAFANCTDHRIAGVQTAIVVGPAGEEIFTNEHGQVKICYHWDMERKHSTWVRVASGFASQNFGFIAIPRVGDEVIIVFLDGNPDRPLIIGSLYNAYNTPSWPLPQSKTQSGILTRSTPKGNRDTANILRFDDQKGAEEVWLRAEKNHRIEVEKDESHWVGNDRSKTIDHDEKVTIHNDRCERVDNDEKISIGNNRDEDVGNSETLGVGKNQDITVGNNRSDSIGKNQKTTIGKNWSVKVGKMKTETIGMAYMQNVGMGRMENVGMGYSLNIGMVMNTVVGLNQNTRVGKKIAIDAGDEYALTVGKASLVMKADGSVVINGTKINIEASGTVTIKGKDIRNN